MRIERVKNFFTPAECEELNAWCDMGVANKWLDSGLSRAKPGQKHRVTSRFYSDRYEYPKLVHTLSERVRQFCGVSSYPMISGHGRDGIVVSCTFPGGDTFAHRDPMSEAGIATLRCNVMTRAAESGSVLHVGGRVVDIEVGELHCYLASEHEHFVTQVEGAASRVLWMFGAHIPADDWNSGKIQLAAT